MDLDHNEGDLYITELSLTSDIHQGEAEALSNASKTAQGGGLRRRIKCWSKALNALASR
jgi:hypothetical protein